jgi:two-component system phosphate regulon sensor histidine kinase PhoR
LKGTLKTLIALRAAVLSVVAALVAVLLAAFVSPVVGAVSGAALGVAGAVWLAHSATESLRRLARAAGPWASGASDRLPPRLGGGDEVDHLTAVLEELGTAARTHEGAREREARQLRHVLETMIEGVLVIGPDGRISLDNAAVRTLLPSAGTLIGRTPLEALRSLEFDGAVRCVLDGDGPRLLDLAVGAGDDPLAGAPRADQPPSRRIFRVSLAPLVFDRGRAVVAVFHDVSRLRELENLRRDFVANVSHELRTPLAAIKGYVETLRDGDVAPADRERFLETVARHTDRLANLIEDLLELSRLESPETRLDIRPAALEPIARRALQLLEGRARQAGIALGCEFPEGLPAVIADAAALEQVFVNLIDNAIKYTGPGGEVFVSAAPREGRVRVSIRDTGAGIPAGELSRLFERFYRVDRGRSREQGGTGLGLAIVKHLVQLHGGEVGVESAPGRGSTFWFTLRVSGTADPNVAIVTESSQKSDPFATETT